MKRDEFISFIFLLGLIAAAFLAAPWILLIVSKVGGLYFIKYFDWVMSHG